MNLLTYLCFAAAFFVLGRMSRRNAADETIVLGNDSLRELTYRPVIIEGSVIELTPNAKLTVLSAFIIHGEEEM